MSMVIVPLGAPENAVEGAFLSGQEMPGPNVRITRHAVRDRVDRRHGKPTTRERPQL
jgi:hypothetical protein